MEVLHPYFQAQGVEASPPSGSRQNTTIRYALNPISGFQKIVGVQTYSM